MSYLKAIFTKPKTKAKPILNGYQQVTRESNKNTTMEFIVYIILAVLFILGLTQIAGAQSYKKTFTSNIHYGYSLGVHDTIEQLYCDITAPNNTKLHPLFVSLHGGGSFIGDKSGGMRPMFDGLVTSLGITVVYPNYRLGDVNQYKGKSIAQSTILMWSSMYMMLQDAYSCVNYMLDNPNIYHIDKTQIFIGGVSWGAVGGVIAVHWQPSEYSILDTMKWRNTSNPDYSFTIAGAICVSGAAFTIPDIDATDKPIILCYGGKDNTLKCYGGSNHRCPYIGSCQIFEAGEVYDNPVYPFYIASAGHCMKGATSIETAMNLMQTKTFIRETLKTLIR